MKNKILYCALIILCNLVQSQDARLMGVSGTYTNIARGYQCVGINPANLAVSSPFSINFASIGLGFKNNAFSLRTINEINGSQMIDPTMSHYYDKENINTLFDGEGIRLKSNMGYSLPLLNLSYRNMAFTTQTKAMISTGIPQGIIDFIFFGNEIGQPLSLQIPLEMMSVQETGLSYAHSLSNVNLGFTIKHLMGWVYSDLTMIDSAYVMTDTTSFEGQGSFLLTQGIGGSGWGMDLGFLTDEFFNGWQLGLSITNLFAEIKWNADSPLREIVDNQVFDYLPKSLQLRAEEFLYYSLAIDSINAISLTEGEYDELFIFDNYPVIRINEITDIEGTVCGENGVICHEEYILIPSEDMTDAELKQYSPEPFSIKYPSVFRFGVSKKVLDEAIFMMDLSTGFSSKFGNDDQWQLSMGAEFTQSLRFPMRVGFSLGGNQGSQFSLGTGIKLGHIQFDTAIAFQEGFSLNSAKGLNVAVSLYWI